MSLWAGLASLVVGILVLLKGGDTEFPSPRGFHVFWTAFFFLYGISLIISTFGRTGALRAWSIGFLIAHSVVGFAGCRSTIQRSEASVHVRTKHGSYSRRPPGGKIADIRANTETLWFRVLAFLCWSAGVVLYFRPKGGYASPPASPNKYAPPLPTASLLKGRVFDHDPQYSGLPQANRDLSMALTAITNYLRACGFSDVSWSIGGETTYSCRAANGRRFSVSVPPPTAPQITASESGIKLRIYIKAIRQPWHSLNLTPDEITTLQKCATNTRVYVGFVSISPTDSDPDCMTGFMLDFRGVIPISRNTSSEVLPRVGRVLSALIIAEPSWVISPRDQSRRK